jgi:hypothetical protein
LQQAIRLAEKLCYLQENIEARVMREELSEEQILFLCQHERHIDVASTSTDEIISIFKVPSKMHVGKAPPKKRGSTTSLPKVADVPYAWRALREGDATGRGDLTDKRGERVLVSLTPRAPSGVVEGPVAGGGDADSRKPRGGGVEKIREIGSGSESESEEEILPSSQTVAGSSLGYGVVGDDEDLRVGDAIDNSNQDDADGPAEGLASVAEQRVWMG